jgi:hypothetical protein
MDALVLKLLAWHLGGLLPTAKSCKHLKGHGGLKQTVRQVYDALPQYPFVYKTDVKGYYEKAVSCLVDEIKLYTSATAENDRTIINVRVQKHLITSRNFNKKLKENRL